MGAIGEADRFFGRTDVQGLDARGARVLPAFLLLLLVVGTGCSESSFSGPPVDRVSITPSVDTARVGGRTSFVATGIAAGDTVGVVWSVLDTAIADIDESGTVLGVSEGETEVRAALASDTTKFATARVVVVDS